MEDLCRPGEKGQLLRARSQTMITASKGIACSSSRSFERWPEISTPTSAMTSTAIGSRPWVSIPANQTSISSPLRALVQLSAIWLRQELPVQRKRTFSLAFIGVAEVNCQALRNGWMMK